MRNPLRFVCSAAPFAAVALFLVACGGGGSSDSQQEPASESSAGQLEAMSLGLSSDRVQNLKWTHVAPMNQARLGHGMVELSAPRNGPGGKVMVIGGFDSSPIAFPSVPANPLASCEIYDPATNVWTPAAPHPVPGGWRWTIALPNGMVLVAGGSRNLTTNLSDSHLYDPTTDRWIATRPLPIGTNNPHGFMHPVLMPNGQVLIAGGEDDNSIAGSELTHTRSSYVFTFDERHPEHSYWDYTRKKSDRQVSRMPEGRTTSALLLMSDGRVLNAGGLGPAFEGVLAATDTASIYDPRTGEWTSAPPMPPVPGLGEDELTASYPTSPGSRWAPASSNLDDGQVLIAGGFAGTFFQVFRKSALLYDPRTNHWHITTPMHQRRYVGSWSGGLAGNAGVLVAGAGFSDSYELLGLTGEIYQPKTKTWTLVSGDGGPPSDGSVDSIDSQSVLLSTGSLQVSGGADLATETLGTSGSWRFGERSRGSSRLGD